MYNYIAMKTRHRSFNKKKASKTRKMRKGGFFNLFSKQQNDSVDNNISTTKDKKQYGNLLDAATVAAQRSAKSWNMPAMLGAINTKLNALLVGNNINYEFSNGYNARDYDMNNYPGNAENDGRGQLKSDAKRGKITGFQSKVYNMAIDTDAYDKGKKHFDKITQKYSSPTTNL
jgi:hypothetical protein